MHILVCGGTGFIGSAFIRNHFMSKSHDTITNLDNLAIGSNPANLKNVEKNPNYNFIKDDIKNLESVSNIAKKADVIINFAAETHVDRSISNPKPFIETNVLGTYSILEAARKLDKLF